MRIGGVLPVVAALVVTSCSGGSSTTSGASKAKAAPSPTPSPATAAVHFDEYAGAYRSDDGTTYAVNGHGHLLNLDNGWFRQLHPTSTADHLTVGPGFMVSTPKEADVTFHLAGQRADQMTLAPVTGQPVVARRLQFKETEVHVPAQGAVLAGTITEPITAGPHPGIVIVHGSGLGPRIDYGVWVALYASLGLTVLAYDKRGNGDSTGQYPGELASEENLRIYADDAAASVRFLATFPGVDAHRVGFHGGSQGGWTVPLAIQRDPDAAFAVLVSGPAVTVGQQGVWAAFSGGSRQLPTESAAAMNAAVRADHSGYDPGPILATMSKPIVWLNGEIDRQVPTTVNSEVLHGLGKSNFDIQVLPGVDHGLFETATGLTQDDDQAQRLGRDVFVRIATWLSAHGFSTPQPESPPTP
jgi:dienelactone hydrolase